MAPKTEVKVIDLTNDEIRIRLESVENAIAELIDTGEMEAERFKFIIDLLEGMTAPTPTPIPEVKPTPRYGRTGAQKVRDNKTGTIYDSLGKCGVALYEEVGAEAGVPISNFMYYKLRDFVNAVEPGRIEKTGE